MKGKSTHIFEFGPFILDITEGQLLKHGQVIHLPPKSLEVLSLLVHRQGHVVTKDDLLATVWSNSEVEENNLTVSISVLRKALGEAKGENKYIETISRRGYRFVAPARALQQSKRKQFEYLAPPGALRSKTIAVLPFENFGAGPTEVYLSLILADALISKLGKIKSGVGPATSALADDIRATPAWKPADNAHPVELLLTGQIQQMGSRTRVTVQLTDVQEHGLLWTGEYHEAWGNIFDGLDVLAERVAYALVASLSSEEHVLLTTRPTGSTEAYQLYVRGRHAWDSRTEAGVKESIKCFERALEIDPNFALAYVGLASSFILTSEYCLLPPKEAMPKAKEAAYRALKIDDALAEAYTVLAFIIAAFDWDAARAEELYLHALRLKPTYATAQQWYADLLATLGRYEESIAAIKKARQLDPFSPMINATVGFYLYIGRRYDQAIAECKRAIEREPDFAMTHLYLGLAYRQKKMYPQALSELHRAEELSDKNFEILGALGNTYAVAGEPAEALKILEYLRERAKQQYVSSYSFALVHVGLGENERALQWLACAYEEHSPWVPHLNVVPEFEALCGNVDFQELLQRLGDHNRANDWEQIKSLAILPVVSHTHNSELAYTLDGITETLINSLSQLPHLRVMARNTVFRFKDTEISVHAVGQSLQVDFVLVGTLQHLDAQLTINFELIDVTDGARIWGHVYQPTSLNILTMQDEIIKDVSESMRLKLSVADRKRLAKRHTESIKAYQLYLKGRHYWNKRTAMGYGKGIALFKQAITEDEVYALAYVGLADCYISLSSWGQSSPQESIPQIKAALTRALELDAELAEAHASLGYLKWLREWDQSGAEKQLRLAIKLNPNYPTAHHWYAVYLRCKGLFNESIEELRHAQRLDPLSLIINTSIAVTYYHARQYDQAIAQCRETLELDPDFHNAITFLGLSYVQKGMHRLAIKELEKAVSLAHNLEELSLLGYAYGVARQRNRAYKVLAELQGRINKEYIDPYFMVVLYTGINEKEQAFHWLEKSYQERSDLMAMLKTFPLLDSLRTDPRFTVLMQKVGHNVT